MQAKFLIILQLKIKSKVSYKTIFISLPFWLIWILSFRPGTLMTKFYRIQIIAKRLSGKYQEFQLQNTIFKQWATRPIWLILRTCIRNIRKSSKIAIKSTFSAVKKDWTFMMLKIRFLTKENYCWAINLNPRLSKCFCMQVKAKAISKIMLKI